MTAIRFLSNFLQWSIAGNVCQCQRNHSVDNETPGLYFKWKALFITLGCRMVPNKIIKLTGYTFICTVKSTAVDVWARGQLTNHNAVFICSILWGRVRMGGGAKPKCQIWISWLCFPIPLDHFRYKKNFSSIGIHFDPVNFTFKFLLIWNQVLSYGGISCLFWREQFIYQIWI